MLSCIIGVKSINSFDYEEAKLREWSNKGILRCPECGEKVIYCKGDYKIPYFRHEVGTNCDGGNSYYEPMTEEHIEGIRILYNRLKEIEGVTNLEVEKYIKNTKQRPDIYFEYGNKRYCIEYQCSPISTQYNKRHELYQLEGIEDIWILGTEKYEFNEGRPKEGLLMFDEKKIKAIENEIDKSEKPLLYMDGSKVYKPNKEGFKCVTRRKGRYGDYYTEILKTKICVKLKNEDIRNLDLDFLLDKENKSLKEIDKIIQKTIIEVEEKIKEVNDLCDEDFIFKYNLSVERFPVFKLCKGISHFTKFETYGDELQSSLFIEVLDNHVKKISDVIEFRRFSKRIFQDLHKRYSKIKVPVLITENLDGNYISKIEIPKYDLTMFFKKGTIDVYNTYKYKVSEYVDYFNVGYNHIKTIDYSNEDAIYDFISNYVRNKLYGGEQ